MKRAWFVMRDVLCCWRCMRGKVGPSASFLLWLQRQAYHTSYLYIYILYFRTFLYCRPMTILVWQPNSSLSYCRLVTVHCILISNRPALQAGRTSHKFWSCKASGLSNDTIEHSINFEFLKQQIFWVLGAQHPGWLTGVRTAYSSRWSAVVWIIFLGFCIRFDTIALCN